MTTHDTKSHPTESMPRQPLAAGDTPPAGSVVAADTSILTPSMVAADASVPPSIARLQHYRLLELVGRGGMGDVYRAHDEMFNRIVAVKVLPPDLAKDEQFVSRFRREAKAVAGLSHPNILSIYTINHDRGHFFFAMQFIDGESLEKRLRRVGVLPLHETLRIVTACLSALEAAHANGLIHRDVKPGNVLLQNSSEHVYLVDFGLVRRIDDHSMLTVTGMVMGTADYMAPEQARGQKNLDPRTDLYSVGAMLYYLLAGRLPFDAQSFQAMLYSHAYENPFPLQEAAPDLPSALVEIVNRLLAKQPDDRPANCREVLAALTPLQAASFRAQYVAEQLQEVAHSVQPAAAFAQLPETYTPWQRARDRLATLIHQRSPQWLQQCQTLEQQVEGEVARALRHKQRLQALHHEGRQLLLELDQQRNAAPTPDEELDRRRAQLTEQVAQLEVQVAQAGARHAQLANRRDALAARLALSSRVPPQSRRKIALLGVGGAALVGVLCWALFLRPSPPPPQPDEQLEEKRIANRLEAGVWHDLMPYVDPTRDTVTGHWHKDNDGVLHAEGGASYSGHARLQVPIYPQGDYELEAKISRRDSDVNLVFPVGEYSARACFGHHQIEGGLVSHYPQPDQALGIVSAVTPLHQGDPPRTVRIVVRPRQDQATVKIYVEETLTCDWTGTCRDVANNVPCQIPDARALGLTISQKSASFHSLRLRMISGHADLTPPQLTPEGQLQFGLAAHYKFDEGQGLYVHDPVGKHDGRLRGGKWAKGFDDGAVYFEEKDFAQVGTGFLGQQANYTITAWGLHYGHTPEFHLCSDFSGDHILSSLRFSRGRAAAALWTPQKWLWEGADKETTTIGKWCFIAARFSSHGNTQGTIKLWVDGRTCERPYQILNHTQANNSRIGCGGGGLIEDLRIYHRALSDDEIAAIRELHAAKAAAANRDSKAEFVPPEGGPVIQTIYHQPRSHFDAAIADNPTNAAGYRQRSHWHAVRQQWPEARADLEAYLRLATGNVDDLESVAAYCLHAGDQTAYKRHASVILGQLPGKTSGGSIAGFLRILLLSRELDEATLELCEAKDKQLQQLPPKHYTHISEPLLLYRQGKWQACIDSATQHFPAGAKHPSFYWPLFYRAMALHQLGDKPKAKAELEAIQNHLEALTLATAGYFDSSPEQRMIWWSNDGLLSQIAYHEASELIRGKREELKVRPEIDPTSEAAMALPEQGASKLRYEPVDAKFPADYKNGQQDFALSFDGTAHVDLPLWYDGSHPLSLEAFVTPVMDVEYGAVIADAQAAGAGLVSGTPPHWQFAAYDGAGGANRYQYSLSNEPLKILRRVHLAGVRDGNMLRLYVDGKLQTTTATLTDFKASPYPLSMGADPKDLFKMQHFFHGVIDEVRISRSVRYTEDFTPAKRLEPDEDTLALYHCDEGSGNRLNDSSGNGYHGTIQNAKWVRADVVPVAQKPKQFADAKNPLPRLAALPAHVASIAAVVVARDEGLVITGGVDAAVYLWDLNQRKQLLKLTQASASIGCLGISPDNRWLAIGTTKGEVELWNLPERLLHRRWKNAGAFVRSLVFTPDSKQLYIAGKQIFLWPMDEETTAIQTVVDQSVFDLAITKDGQTLIAGAPDGKVTVYTIVSELKLVREFTTGGILHGLALSPDGRQLMTVGGVGWNDQRPGQVQIWDWSSGKRLKNFAGHRGFASDGEFLPDGRHIVTGGRNDRTLRVWNVETEQAVSCVASDSHCFAFLTVAPDGQQIFSGGGTHYEFGKYEDDGDNRLFFWSLEDIRARKALP